MSAPDFSWDDVDVAVPEQARIAVYTNPVGCAVIRMDGQEPHDEDPFVVVQPRYLRDLIISLELLADKMGV